MQNKMMSSPLNDQQIHLKWVDDGVERIYLEVETTL